MDDIIMKLGLMTVKGIYVFLVLTICDWLIDDFTISVSTTLIITLLFLLYDLVEAFIKNRLGRS